MGITNIEWCDFSWNPWWGCTKVVGDPACHNCYAEALAHRFKLNIWGNSKPRKMQSDAYWAEPLKWNRRKSERRLRVFCASMGDVFEDRRDLDEPRARLWNLIDATPNLDWLLLTKRPEHISFLDTKQRNNIWLGCTAVTQEHYDLRLPKLLQHEAAVHFVSLEPIMEHIDLCLQMYPMSAPRPEWVIVGGESGPKARPVRLAAIHSIVDQCHSSRPVTPCFVKQLGSTWSDGKSKGNDPNEWPIDLRVRQFPNPTKDV